ncbi:hypothetical protein Mterra_02530 [Calidithermus terrae]|uniref:DUF6265 domain-containing protein n=1 Tax=Calidithermus terrae TaxID=1408545 RepID=A0A399EDS2_9DEIN|nr:DUF6265 family protein [Calidithermus terrae]RIH82784.1 hypothetical protein Mterra_02530 [Calidithermus terrae]
MPIYPTQAQQASLEALSWLTGAWRGHKGLDEIDEYWSYPAHGLMMGMFRWVREEKPWFTEHVTITQEPEGLILRIKHFNPGLVGWEEKEESVKFCAVELEPARAVFYRLNPDKPDLWMLYEHLEPGTLHSYFAQEGKEVAPEDKFVYRRFSL